MKPPDPKACARIAAEMREYCVGKQPSFLLLENDDGPGDLGVVRAALEFCAREPATASTKRRAPMTDTEQATETAQEKVLQARAQAFGRVAKVLAKLEPTERLIVLDAIARLEGGHLVKPKGEGSGNV